MNVDGMSILAGFLFLGAQALTLFIYDKGGGYSARKTARIGVLLALALTLSLLESLLPDFLLPGMRLGLANVALLVVLYVYGFKEGLAVATLKAVLASMLRGSFFTMGGLMALTGTLLSFLAMASLHALIKKCSIFGVSVWGALWHVTGQILIARIYLGQAVWGYWPWLLLASFLTGLLTGGIALALTRNKALLRYLRQQS